jgi:hypothetical protein
MSYPPTDHAILDTINDSCEPLLTSPEMAVIHAWSRESECIEFFDSAEAQWYEIVVRPIDDPDAA